MPDARIQIRLLGAAEVVVGGAAVDRFPTRRQLALLAYLALYPNWQLREAIAEAIWPDQPEGKALASLRNGLSVLRRMLEPEATLGLFAIEATRTHARLSSAVCDCDVWRFQGAVTREEWSLATEVYGGDLLGDVYDEWLEPFREGLRFQFHSACAVQTGRLLAKGEEEKAVALAERWKSSDPFDGEAMRHYVLALAAAGRGSAALSLLERFEAESLDAFGEIPFDGIEIRQQIGAKKASPKRPAPESATPPTIPREAEAERRLPLYLSRFFGREREIAEIQTWAAGPSSLLTILGTGGVGKTRLTIEASLAALVEAWDVVFVPLAGADSYPGLIAALMRSLEVREAEGQTAEEAIRAYLRGHQRPMIVILDNVEQLADSAGSAVLDLLPVSRGLKFLLTSREPIGIEGEELLRLDPLGASPSSDEGDLAVRMFVDRARNTRSDFAITARNQEDVTALCRELEGLPLAIEIVAAWAGAWSVAHMRGHVREREIVSRKRVHEPRHRSLEACIEWSFDLLNQETQEFLVLLSLFRGGWTLAAAEAVTGRSNASEILASLVDRSLVSSSEIDGEMRFSMLESVRAYLRIRLGEDQARVAATRFAEFYANLATSHTNPCVGMQEGLNHRSLDRERENFEAVASMCEDGLVSVEAACAMAGTLQLHWTYRAQATLGIAMIERILAVEVPSEPGPGRFLAQQALCVLARETGDAAKIEETLADFRTMTVKQEDLVLRFRVLTQTGAFFCQRGQFAEALEPLLQGLATAAQTGLTRMDAVAHCNVAEALFGLDRVDEAIHHWTVATRLDLANGNIAGEAMLYLGFAEALQNRFASGARYLDTYLRNARGLDFGRGYARAVYYSGLLAARRGDMETAGALAASAGAFIRAEGYVLDGIERKCMGIVDAALPLGYAAALPIEEGVARTFHFLETTMSN